MGGVCELVRAAGIEPARGLPQTDFRTPTVFTAPNASTSGSARYPIPRVVRPSATSGSHSCNLSHTPRIKLDAGMPLQLPITSNRLRAFGLPAGLDMRIRLVGGILVSLAS